MPFVAGAFSVFTPGTPFVTGTTISSATANSVNTDFATGLSTCVLKDGSQTITANIPMSGFKFTGMGAGTVAGNSLRYEDVYGSQSANKALIGPSSGASAAPTFRILTGFDIPLRSYLSGLTMSTAGSSTTMTIAAGQATDSTTVQGITLAASIGKTTSTWAVGTGNGGLDTGAIATGTWYHFWLIMRTDTGVVDVLISLSASAPTMPTNYTLKRRIGSGKTDGSSQWVAFTQDGDYFRLAASVQDVNTTNPGTSAVTSTLASVPTGINVQAMFMASIVDTTPGSVHILCSDLAANDEVPSASNSNYLNTTATGGGVQLLIRTNTSAQLRYRLDSSNANTIVRFETYGWWDYRGRNA